MKNIQHWISGLVFCILFGACSKYEVQLTVTNPVNIERIDEMVILKRDWLEQKLGPIGAGKFIAVKSSDGNKMTVQFDDLDSDGKWEEAVFLYSFKPSQKAGFTMWLTGNGSAEDAGVRAHVRHRKKNADDQFDPSVEKDTMPVGAQATDFSKQSLPPYLTEGPAWENDRVGFRIYFDVRNGKDIWGKTTNKMIMDEVGLDTTKNYHLLSDWGMDILKVGKSLGAGSLALLIPRPKIGDTLIRLGGANMGQVRYEKIADGPVRAVLRLHYHNWKISDSLLPINITEQISIWGGQYFYESKVSVEPVPPGARLVTGIVNLYNSPPHQIDEEDVKILYTYNVQSENKDKLGMAIAVRKKDLTNIGVTPDTLSDIQHTYTVAQNIKSNTPLLFRFYAGWERSDERFKSEEGFSEFLKQEAIKWNAGLKLE